ncbi:MAG: hypothetical protein ABEJ56_03300 [Candidatus Nanohaloarchaea archaeon]
MSTSIGRRAYVFVVDKYSYPVHRSRGFCGVKDPRLEWNFSGKSGLYADMLGTRPGDLVFFYQRRIDEPADQRGYRGIYEIKSRPFKDKRPISWKGHTVLGQCPECGTTHPEKMTRNGPYKCKEDSCGAEIERGSHIVPNRVEIEPVNFFPESVDDNTAYVDRTDPGYLWTMLFRKTYGAGTERSASPILPEEAEKLERLLKKENENEAEVPDFEPYPDISGKERLKPKLGEGPKVDYEHGLHAWIMDNIDEEIPVLKDVVGPLSELEWSGNEVMYGIGRSKADVLLLHKRDGKRFKATVIELKEGKVKKEDIDQIDRYSYWVSQLATANANPSVENLKLQPVVIGSELSDSAREKLNSWDSGSVEIPTLDLPDLVPG